MCASASARRTAVADRGGAGRVAVDAQGVDPQRQDGPVRRGHRAAGQAQRLAGRLLGIRQHRLPARSGAPVRRRAGRPGRRTPPRAPAGRRASTMAMARQPEGSTNGVPEPQTSCTASRSVLVDGPALPDLLVERAVGLHRLEWRYRRPGTRPGAMRSCSSSDARQFAHARSASARGRSRADRGRTDGRRPARNAPARPPRSRSWRPRHRRGRHRRRWPTSPARAARAHARFLRGRSPRRRRRSGRCCAWPRAHPASSRSTTTPSR